MAMVATCALLAGCSVSTQFTQGQEQTRPTAVVNAFEAEPATVADALPTPTPLTWPVEVTETLPSNTAIGVAAYEGLGAWLDVWDYSPNYSNTGVPPASPDVIDEMAAAGVRTLYLQTVRRDDRTTALTEDPELLAEFIRRAHDNNIAVIGWYLPTWTGPEQADLDRLVAILDFEHDGQRFDGIAVDIEGKPTVAQRADWNQRLITLSRDLRAAAGDRAIGAIVLPPVLLEEVNDQYWPDFPWAEIEPFYDTWMPMAYWSNRKQSSPWANPERYVGGSIERLRVHLGDPDAIVHAIGGIGLSDGPGSTGEPIAGVDDLAAFEAAIRSTASVGWSIYDWMTISSDGRQQMAALAERLG